MKLDELCGGRASAPIVVTAALMLAACAGGAVTAPGSGKGKALTPGPPGPRLLIAAEPLDVRGAESVDAWVGTPGGVISYTALLTLKGLDESAGHRLGARMNARELTERYPNSVLVLGLNLKGHLQFVADGRAAAQIERLLDTLESYQVPVLIRFGYEFDNRGNAYDPATYKFAWSAFRERLVARNNPRIRMVWHAAADCGNTHANHLVPEWYPGDDQVDWMGVSLFRPGRCSYLAPDAMAAFARTRGKPLLIAESTPQGYDLTRMTYSDNGANFAPRSADQIWRHWYAPYFAYIERNADVVRGVTYINAHWDASPVWGPPYNKGYWGDSRLEVNGEILQRWRAQVAGPLWLKGTPDLFEQLRQLSLFY